MPEIRIEIDLSALPSDFGDTLPTLNDLKDLIVRKRIGEVLEEGVSAASIDLEIEVDDAEAGIEAMQQSLDNCGLGDISTVELLEEMSELEEHLLDIFGAETFEEAMRDDTNFMTFISMLMELEPEFESDEFIAILCEAVGVIEENAQFFLDSLDDLREYVEDQDALSQAEVAAKVKLGLED